MASFTDDTFENDHGIDLSEMNGNGFFFSDDTFDDDHEIDFFEMNENLDDFLNTHISMRLVQVKSSKRFGQKFQDFSNLRINLPPAPPNGDKK